MAKKLLKNTLYIAYTTDKDGVSSFSIDKDTTDISIKTVGSSKIVTVNPNFYNKNRLYCNELISSIISENISDIIVSNSDFIKNISLCVPEFKQVNLYILKDCMLNIESIKNLDSGKISKMMFEEDISVDIAHSLAKCSIPFYTTKLYKLLDDKKFTGNNELLTFSDYYNLTELKISDKLTKSDLGNLSTLFSFNKSLIDIKLDTDLKTSYEIIKSYVENISKYSHAQFNIRIPSIIMSKSNDEYLYNIHQLLNSNNCKLNLVTPEDEVISYNKYTKSLAPLRKFANKLSVMKLSTIEKLILIEDYTKSKPYQDSYNKFASRKLFSSLNSEYVVCYTYASTFKALCDYVGIPATVVIGRMSREDGFMSEHAKVICRINDAKYQKSGLYIFEPTFDACNAFTASSDEKPCDNYLYFANTIKEYSDVYDLKIEELGLLKYVNNEISPKNAVQKSECIRQLNELNIGNTNSYTSKPVLDITIHQALQMLDNADVIDIDTFKSALLFSRSKIEEFTKDDVDRIVRINANRAMQNVSEFSSNRFSDPTLCDDCIITFDDYDII